MAGITLAQAETKLSEWLSASEKLQTSRSVTVNGRSITYADLDQVLDQIDYWNRMVIRLSRSGGVSAQRVIVND